MSRRFILIAALAAGALVVSAALLNPALTRYVEGPKFRGALEKETAKGLHFPEFSFGPIRRTGVLSASSDSGTARNGRKAITTLDAHDIVGHFNPWGVFLRRWSIDDLHVERLVSFCLSGMSESLFSTRAPATPITLMATV